VIHPLSVTAKISGASFSTSLGVPKRRDCDIAISVPDRHIWDASARLLWWDGVHLLPDHAMRRAKEFSS
jgi:hypothetical protein